MADVDKNGFLIDLSEKNYANFWEADYETLSRPEQVFRAVWDLESDVNNGGFDQYFFNASGDTSFDVVNALKAIGANKVAAVLSKAVALFGLDGPARDQSLREEQLENAGLGDEDLRAEKFEPLTAKFLEYPDDLTGLLYDYVLKNAANIRNVQLPV